MDKVIRVVASMTASAFVFAIYCVGGGEFERGENMALTLVCAICAWLLVYFAPHWED